MNEVTVLHAVPSVDLSEAATPEDFILRAIAYLSCGASGHKGVSRQELRALFRRQFNIKFAALLTSMIQAGSVVVAELEYCSCGSESESKSRLVNVEILEAMPKERDATKRPRTSIRVYRSDSLPKSVRTAYDRRQRDLRIVQNLFKFTKVA